MDIILNFLPKIGALISWLTPKKMLLTSAFVLVVIFSITLFENRELVFDTITSGDALQTPKKIQLPDHIVEQVTNMVDNNKKIVFFSLVSSSIRLNQSQTMFFYTDSVVLREMNEISDRSFGTLFPIFTAREEENAQMVSAINGEFSCFKFEDTFKFRVMPEGQTIAPYVCNISLPPYYGEFSGFITFGLISEPTEADIDLLRLTGTRISTEIYARNFKSILQ